LIKQLKRVDNVAVRHRIMDKSFIIERLRSHEEELRASGIVHLRLFGSVARGEASSRSDVDLLAEFDKSKSLTLVSVGSLQSRLAEILGVDVDLSSADWMREPVRTKATREAVLAF
jgi:predicted nucleotidyltransferase